MLIVGIHDKRVSACLHRNVNIQIDLAVITGSRCTRYTIRKVLAVGIGNFIGVGGSGT